MQRDDETTANELVSAINRRHFQDNFSQRSALVGMDKAQYSILSAHSWTQSHQMSGMGYAKPRENV